MKRTVEQNRALHGLIKLMADAAGVELAEAKDWAQKINWEINRKRHTSECTVEECDKLIEKLRSRTTNCTNRKTTNFTKDTNYQKSDPEGMITKKQLDVLQHMYEDLGWFELRQQKGFNMRIVKKPWPQTRGEGVKIYQALEVMILKKMPKENVRELVIEMLQYKSKFNDWEREFALDLMRKIEQHKKISGRMIKKGIEIKVKYEMTNDNHELHPASGGTKGIKN